LHNHIQPGIGSVWCFIDIDGSVYTFSHKLCMDGWYLRWNHGSNLHGLSDSHYKLFSHWHQCRWKRPRCKCDHHSSTGRTDLYDYSQPGFCDDRSIIDPNRKLCTDGHKLHLDRGIVRRNYKCHLQRLANSKHNLFSDWNQHWRNWNGGKCDRHSSNACTDLHSNG
jgi:hypothetical protein